MKKKSLNIFCTLVLASCLVFQIGCASFPPPHANSFYNKDETVTVKMLKLEDVRDYYKQDWEKSFNISLPEKTKALPVIAVTLIGIVANVAIDYGKKLLNQEAENYTQQFGTTYFDAFWQGHNPKYYGFEITRKAKRYNAKSKETAEEVFKIAYGLAQDKEGFFWAAPLYFQTNKTKAKVASWWWSGKHTKHRIDTKIEIALDAVWIDKDQKYNKSNIAKFDPLMIKGYRIDEPKVLKASCKSEDPTCSPLEGGLNSFPAIPISKDSDNPGKFWLTVLVTESDTAKTKKYISDLSDLLEKNKDKIIDFIKKPTS